MRIMGYPPGWLEHAKEYSSGLQLINCVKSPSKEEKQTLTYDYDRIIDFPGFNVALDSKFRDVCEVSTFYVPLNRKIMSPRR